MESRTASDFSGSYTLEAQGSILTLILSQDAQRKISGTLSSAGGMQFQLDGRVEGDAAVGACHGETGSVYFEAYFTGNQLLLALIEPDADNMPDYNRVKQLTFTRREGAPKSQKEIQDFDKTPVSDLIKHFAGTWVNYTRNTETKIILTPDGDYFEYYEASYSGQFHDQYGIQTGDWGTARQDQNRGRWTIRGDQEHGQVVITFKDGREVVVEYQVHIEKGKTYWREYWFNGELYGKQ